MTITTEQEAYITKMVVGLFNVAPGKQYLDEYSTLVEDGTSMEELAAQLAESSAYKDGMLNGDASTDGQVAHLMENFGLTYGEEDPESVDRMVEEYLKGEYETGYSTGDIMLDIINFMDSEVPEQLVPLQTAFHNKVRIAEAYSEDEYAADSDILYAYTGDEYLDDEKAKDIVAQAHADEYEDNGFSVLEGIEAIQYAQSVRDEFLKEAAQDPETPGMEPALTEQEVADALTKAIAEVDAVVAEASTDIQPGDYIAATGNAESQDGMVKTAMGVIDRAKGDANDHLKTANANIAAVAGLPEAIEALKKAQEKEAEAQLNAQNSFLDYGKAENEYNDPGRLPSPNPTANETLAGGDGSLITSISDSTGTLILDSGGGALVLETGVTETTNPGIEDLLNAANAYNTSVNAATQATADVATAQDEVDRLDPDGSLQADLTEAEAEVAAAQAAMEKLDKAVENQEKAQANVDQLAEINAKIDAAFNEFVLQGLDEPIQLNEPTTAATDGNDNFFVGTDPSPEITGFGESGKDQLVIGSNYVINYDEVAGNNGDNYALEFWVTPDNGNTLVTIEQSVWGSNAKVPETTVVTLVGITPDELEAYGGMVMAGEPVEPEPVVEPEPAVEPEVVPLVA